MEWRLSKEEVEGEQWNGDAPESAAQLQASLAYKVPGQPGLPRETLSQKAKDKQWCKGWILENFGEKKSLTHWL